MNLTKDGDLVPLNGTGKLYEHNVRQVKASTNSTYVAIGDNDVGYHEVGFKLLAFCKHRAIQMKTCVHVSLYRSWQCMQSAALWPILWFVELLPAQSSLSHWWRKPLLVKINALS